MTVHDHGVYLYAVTGARPVPGLVGVLGAPVRSIEAEGLSAHVSTVPLDQFGEEPLRRNLEDLDWLEAVARAHHRVVEALADAGPAAPVRLVTVYRDDEQVRALLARRHDEFADVLAYVAGRREWGVKAYLAPPSAPEPGGGAAASRAAAQGAGAGLAYLRRRKESLRSREELWRAALHRGERLHAALSGLAVASRRHRPQDPRLSGRTDWMVLNGAYLVDRDHDDEFAAAVAAWRGEGMDVELTGPWAPYSFTSVELEGADAVPEERP